MEFLMSLSQIMLINIILSGDNAIVIAMASRALPAKQQKMAILWGSAGAVGLRIVLTLLAATLLKMPYLQFFGGIMLVWIAIKLLLESNESADEESTQGPGSLLAAIKTIVLADIIMSVDNTLAIAAIARDNTTLLIAGLGLSVPVIVFGSRILVRFMERFPVIIYLGAGLIAWTAGVMIIDDPQVGPYIIKYSRHILAASISAGVIAVGYSRRRRQLD